jgi:catechol 2,3-dioxygenase-like lactoylglutathione lyase family enzyme
MMIDHFGLGVSDYTRSKAFYAAALAPLGMALVMEVGPEQSAGKVWGCGFGKSDKPEFLDRQRRQDDASDANRPCRREPR